jgi:SAM-dependent methyltransferase
MTSSYDPIGESYAAVKALPLPRGTEIPAVEALLGDLRGKSLLDLACGQGFYSRLASRRGARPVVGVDLSEAMVEAALREEQRAPLGIRYLQADAASVSAAQLGYPEGFDQLLALFLFNYATDPASLRSQAQAVCRCLRPGGRLLAVLPDPAFRCGSLETEAYGFRTRVLEEREEGRRFQVDILLEPPIQLVSWQWTRSTVEASLAAAGLEAITWHPIEVSAEALDTHGTGFWHAYRTNPPNIALSAIRP